jgi:hypothetical protein
MQQAVFLFTQIFFVVLAVAVIGIVILTVIKNRGRNTDLVSDKNIESKQSDKSQ